MNLRVLVFGFFGAWFIHAALWAQSQWNLDLYKQISLSNFRKFEPFHQPINLHHPDILLLNAALFYVTNEQRKLHGQPPLEYLPALEIMAFQHSKRMLKWQFFSHIDPVDFDRKGPQMRAKLAGIVNPYVSENIIRFSVTPGNTYLEVAEEAVRVWMNSKGHRKNILSRSAVQLGCGAYMEETGLLIATQNFQNYEWAQLREPQDLLPGDFAYPWWEYHTEKTRILRSRHFSKALVFGIAREAQYYWGEELFRVLDEDEEEYRRIGFPVSVYAGFTFWRNISLVLFSRWGVHNQYRISEMVRQQEWVAISPDTNMHAFPYEELQIGFLFGDYIRFSVGMGRQRISLMDGAEKTFEYYMFCLSWKLRNRADEISVIIVKQRRPYEHSKTVYCRTESSYFA